MPSDITIGGIYVSSFVGYAAAAFVLMLLLRPLLARLPLTRYVANPPLAEAGIYLCILAALILVLH